MRAYSVRPGGRCGQHPGTLPYARHQERHRLRHGRDHGQAGVIYKGEALTTGAALIGGYDKALPVQIAMMDIFEVGAFGGGSIARVEDGTLRVGPQSAGAQPGPACYGLGGEEPTVTGEPGARPARRRSFSRWRDGLDTKAAERALAKAGKPLGMSATQAADGILRIAATAMSYAVKGVTTERGLDAGDFALVAYGGAGPLHAVAVAREIGIRNVIIPGAPGVFSAFGMLFSDLRYDYVRTHLMQLADAPFDEIEQVFDDLERQGREAIAATSVKPHKITVKRARHALRRAGASGDGRVAATKVFQSRTARPSSSTSTTTICSAMAPRRRPSARRSSACACRRRPDERPRRRSSAVRPRRRESALSGKRPVSFDGKFRAAPTYRRSQLLAGNKIAGPALIEEHASTTVLMPGDRMTVDAYGNVS